MILLTMNKIMVFFHHKREDRDIVIAIKFECSYSQVSGKEE